MIETQTDPWDEWLGKSVEITYFVEENPDIDPLSFKGDLYSVTNHGIFVIETGTKTFVPWAAIVYLELRG